MSILYWREGWHQRRATIKPTLTINDIAANNSFGIVKYSRNWKVTTNNTLDEILVLLSDPRCPHIYDPYVGANGIADPTALCSDVQIEQNQEDPQNWMVKAEYSTDLLPNPLLRPSEVTFDFAPYKKAIYEDINGNPIKNSADDPYDPAPEIDDSRPVVRITRNEPVPADASVAILYQDAINSDSWFGANPGQAKIMKIKFAPKYDSLIPYVTVEYEIQFRREGWDLILLDLGHHTLDAMNNQVLARDPVDAAPLANPVLLDGTGKKLAHGAQPIYNHFTVYKQLAFGDLNLP